MSDANFNSLQLLAMARCGIDPKDLESLNYKDFQNVYVDDKIASMYFEVYSEFQKELFQEIADDIKVI